MRDLTNMEHQILGHIGKSERVSFNVITRALSLNPISIRFRLNELSSLGLVELWCDTRSPAEYWVLTDQGRKYLEDNGPTQEKAGP